MEWALDILFKLLYFSFYIYLVILTLILGLCVIQWIVKKNSGG